MKILFILHADFEKPGYLQTWAEKNKYETQEVCPYKGEILPDIQNFDFLIIMGGAQSPLKIDQAPYLLDEVKLIAKAIEKKKRVIGFCLGAQLIGEALGARTERSPNREIGAYPIELLQEAKYDPVLQNFPTKFDVMHWHNDMPGIPEGGVLLARSEGCPKQIFRYGDRIYGFQCHLELTKDLVKEMMANCSNDLKAGRYIMSETKLMQVNYSEINAKLEIFLDYLANLPAADFQTNDTIGLQLLKPKSALL